MSLDLPACMFAPITKLQEAMFVAEELVAEVDGMIIHAEKNVVDYQKMKEDIRLDLDMEDDQKTKFYVEIDRSIKDEKKSIIALVAIRKDSLRNQSDIMNVIVSDYQ